MKPRSIGALMVKQGLKPKRFVLWCLVACGVLSVALLFVSMQQATTVEYDRRQGIPSKTEWMDDEYKAKQNANGSLERHEHYDKIAQLMDVKDEARKLTNGGSHDAEERNVNVESRSERENRENEEEDRKQPSESHHQSHHVHKPATAKKHQKHHHEDGQHHHHTHHHRPPLDSLISDSDRGVKGHVSFLLDWAIIGHAKAATSFIMKWLSRHPEVQTWDEEVCDLFDNRPAGLVKRLYKELPEGDYKRGFKCPGHFSRRSIRYFKRYFHNAKVIVGIRNPVRWFESFYNFRLRHAAANYTLPDPHKLIGVCTPEMDGICTDRANFHTNLAVFGKTNMTDPVERNLIRFRKYTYESTYHIHNPLFLYDVAQFYDTDQSRVEKFKVDLQHFLGLQQPMPEPTEKDAGKSSRPKPKAIDICHPKYAEVRQELVTIGKRASMWIRKHLLKSDEVFVSSPEHFENILKEWKEDPCIAANATAVAKN